MPRPPETDDQSIASDEELRLLDLLYGELDDVDAEQAKRELDGDDELAGELEGLTHMRSLFADLPDEEPPQAISAKLLQAAAAHAPKPAKAAAQSGGFWAWLSGLFKPIVHYPGLAAIASLVLVVGIAGTLYMSGKGRTTEPKADQANTADRAEKSGEAIQAWDDKAVAPTQPDSPARYADMDEDLGLREAEPTDNEKAAEAERPSPKKTGTKSKDTGREVKRDNGGRGGGSDTDRTDDLKVTSESTIFLGGEDGEGDTDKSPASGNAPSEDPAPEPEPEADGISVDVPPPDLKTLPKDDSNSDAKGLHDKAKKAAKRGDCAATRSYGSKIRSIDVGYYNDVYLRDATVRKCAATQDSQSTKK
jgi:hypothetical protein